MTDTPQFSPEQTTATPLGVPASRHDHAHHRSSRLNQVLAWVGIIAGVVFIVAVIFFSGVFFGRVSAGYHGWHRGYHGGQMGPRADLDDCPMTRPGPRMGPGQVGPGGMMGPQQSPSTVVPAGPRS